MRATVARFIDFRDGEGTSLTQAFFTLFGIIAGHTILETARDALFLTKLPPSYLTLVYAVLAALALVLSSVNAAFVRRFGRRNALLFTLVAAAYGTTLLHFVPQTDAALFALYVWSGLLGTVLAVQFWMLAGRLFTVAQGKRLFGPIAAGGVLGAAVGAGLAAALLSAMMSIGALLLVAAAIFLATALFLTWIPVDGLDMSNGGDEPEAKAVLPKGIIALFREQPYLRRLGALVAVSTAAVLTTDFLFKSVAAESIPTDQLGAFFARFYAALNGIALIVQIFLASRIIRNVGVGPALMVLPVLIVGGAAGMFVLGGALIPALLMKGADGALRHSLHRVASELLWMPLSGEARDRAKGIIDTVFGRLVQAVVAAALLLLMMLGLDSPRLLAALVLGLAAAWMAINISLRRPYLDLFRRALSRGSIDARALGDDLDIAAVEAIMEALSSRDSARVIAAMDVLRDRNRSRLIPGLILYHESPEVLVRALAIVSDGPRTDWMPLAERLLSHADEGVRVAAIGALGRRGATHLIERAADDASPAVRAHAAFHLAHGDQALHPLDDPRIAELLALSGEAGRAARVALLTAIQRAEGAPWADVILKLLGSDDPIVAEQAAMALTRTQDPRFIPLLISRLALREVRVAVREALVSHGDAAFEALVTALRDSALDQRIRAHVPRAIAGFATQDAADHLVEQMLVEPSGVVRYKILRALGRITAQHKVKVPRAIIEEQMRRNLIEHLRLLSLWVPLSRGRAPDPSRRRGAGAAASGRDGWSGELERGTGGLILGLLEDKQKQSLERAFRLLQIIHRNEDIRGVYLTLRMGDRRRRANALEFLDALTVPSGYRPASGRRGRGAPGSRASGLRGPMALLGDERREGESRELLRLVADDLSPEERVARAARYLPNQPKTYDETVAALLREKDDSLASLAAYHALELGQTELRAHVQEAYRQRPTLPLTVSLDLFGVPEELFGVG